MASIDDDEEENDTEGDVEPQKASEPVAGSQPLSPYMIPSMEQANQSGQTPYMIPPTGLPGSSNNTQNIKDLLAKTSAASNAQPEDKMQNIKDLLSQNQLLKASQEDLLGSRGKGIKPEDLNDLAKRQNTDQLTKLFMNFAGATNRVNATPFTNAVGADTAELQQRLGLQQQLADKNFQRGVTEQQLGMQQYNAEKQNQPISKAMLETLVNPNRNRAGLENIDTSVEYPMSMLPQLLSQSNEGIKTALALKEQEIQRQHNKATENLAATKMDKPIWRVDPVTGKGGWIHPDYNAPTTPPSVGFLQTPGASSSQGNTGQNGNPPQKTMNYQDLLQAAPKIARGEISKIQSDYQKKYGDADNQYKQSMDNLEATLGEAERGNFKASGALPVLAAKAFEGIKGRLTNYDIQLSEKDKSYYEQLKSFLDKQAGQGSITTEQAKQIRNLTNKLKDVHENTENQIKDKVRTRIKSVVPNFDDDAYLFGKSPSSQQGVVAPTKNPPVGQNSVNQPVPVGGMKVSSLDDLLK